MGSLEIDSLDKSYGAAKVLKDINIEIEEGGFLVLVGPSGCGKSTLLNSIAGLEDITGGEIRIAGKKVNDLAPADRDIAMVFQSYALYPNMTVRGNIAFGMEIRKIPKAERDEAVHRVATLLQIEDLLDRKPSQLSGGQRQRVAMGRALVREPQVFLFDEPLSNLDAKLRVDMRTEIKKLHQRLGATIVYVTHDQIEAMTLATKIAVLKGGVLQQAGTPAEIYNNPVNTFVAEFMGSPSMNLIPAQAGQGPNGPTLSIARKAGDPLVLPAPEAVAAYAGRGVLLGLRPEAITDEEAADRNARVVETASCRIDVLEPSGADTYCTTDLGGKDVIGRLRADAPIRQGEDATLAFNLDKAVIFDPDSGERIA
ncbi:sn-glycerol-3-phosphate ABC transporter ATP-binding protein UgpC [Mesobaculum littorinae]|uniref:sn-glycerol-3-phosphate ABC transporter ATP-binding protein UgpC n=1 Tax=Mesobaculum littorinae TaxID=2486419 RepID=A0A438AD12_9RHOB|nr:sn-glycerol-3-phosphate ABC transporter ATP-binding protein UgpC [Mesobaculum littorinae]RVV96591.1 sn-glycerol-3-phosphate ABC transporter ATP-binding protein UgpC [Mesobaculum littorinae]